MRRVFLVLASFFILIGQAAQAQDATKYRVTLKKITCFVKNEVSDDECSLIATAFSTDWRQVHQKVYDFSIPAIQTSLADAIYNFRAGPNDTGIGPNPDGRLWGRAGEPEVLGSRGVIGLSFVLIERDNSDPKEAMEIGRKIGGEIGKKLGELSGLPVVPDVLEWSAGNIGALVAREVAPRVDPDEHVGTELFVLSLKDVYEHFSQTDDATWSRHVMLPDSGTSKNGKYRLDFVIERVGPRPKMENAIHDLKVIKNDPNELILNVEYTYDGSKGDDPAEMRIEAAKSPPDPIGDGNSELNWHVVPGQLRTTKIRTRDRVMIGRNTIQNELVLRYLGPRQSSSSKVTVTLFHGKNAVATKTFDLSKNWQPGVYLKELNAIGGGDDTLIFSMPYEVTPAGGSGSVTFDVQVLLPSFTAKGTPYFESGTIRSVSATGAVTVPLRWIGQGAKPTDLKMMITATGSEGLQARRVYSATVRWP